MRLELKDVKDDGSFEGYGSVFGVLDSQADIVEVGAFTESLKSKPVNQVKMLWAHDTTQPIGLWTEIREDNIGLHVKGQILKTLQKGNEVLELMRHKIVDGLSIGFKTIKSVWDEGGEVRRILSADLWEVSVVMFPANSSARVSQVKSLRDVEHVLREGGVPSSFAKLVAKYGYESAQAKVSRRDGDNFCEQVRARLAGVIK